MSNLNKDILLYIFEELFEDKNSLYSCLRVNRLWCETAVTILWKDPWIFLNRTLTLKLQKRANIFFNIIFLNLSEESKNYLLSEGIDIFKDLSLQKSPLFDYISFIKYIKNQYCYMTINGKNIYDILFKNDYNDSQRFILEKEIYKLFVSKCSRIKYLDITDFKHPLYEFPGSEKSLLELNELNCRSDDDSELFFGLAHICKSIESFHILHNYSNDGLAKLIEMQQKLKYLKIDEPTYVSHNDKLSNCNIGQEIIKHAHNLIYLSIERDLEFFETLFAKLINIQKLKLCGTSDKWISLNLDKHLEFVYSELQVLNVSQITYSIAIEIIKKTTGSIQKIWADSMHIRNLSLNSNTGHFIQCISQFCPNLKYVRIALNDDYLDKLESLLTNCKLLEGLYIYKDKITFTTINMSLLQNQRSSTYNNINPSFTDKLLDKLIRFAPRTLYKIGINYCNFKITVLDRFFNHWKGRKTLHLYSIVDKDSNDCFYNLNYINEMKNLIEKYTNEGVIKKFQNCNFNDDKDFKWCY
ncbi:uncharacterized protein OCT59_015880 [Rhizophagus irregularis]|uniref:F-box domain-containing protein n=3 Tax=Rhizophagus irregularis TaxID=588596 RepID=A0A015JC95_RHIIW|nr:hypothetical protein GLOIN_2v1879996 [Rhizophagus irregularis DAOM 181602=DAOM 197198]EXX64540.1 hypothetical protein RirG_141740 [Rhizophagus irregularis DAOM 197198w]POG66274.1 hypothetical protein GLOIN_2v1879996 [Rhizophagus irregularis DAOM 181602=DAOM 197198]UZO23545.1 hypothetical protein OCT59_015880 [Rhizophagus irregularis]CAG8719956.1 11914_t:CDS:1 [Rhizophagus irregularis]|eukprot:XP_025173140.1 hypothetical protein GLOIN_2v1879996 [Rhizophagus irregularis DAOM 181602=DAOM 197198]